MIDSLTFNQLRAFVCVCEEASFSKAAKRLRRAQSAVSHAVAALEESLGVPLFEREGRKPELTAAGRLLLTDARMVIARTEELKTRARSIARAGSAHIRLAVDAFFPHRRLIAALLELRKIVPEIHLSLLTSTVQQGEALLLDDKCDLALGVGEIAELNASRIERRYLGGTEMIPVCAPDHPLAVQAEPAAAEDFERYTQLAISDPVGAPETFRNGMAGERYWLLPDLSAQQDFLRAGLAWGYLPRELVAEDIAAGRLARIVDRTWRAAPITFVMSKLRGRQLTAIEADLVDRLATPDPQPDSADG